MVERGEEGAEGEERARQAEEEPEGVLMAAGGGLHGARWRTQAEAPARAGTIWFSQAA